MLNITNIATVKYWKLFFDLTEKLFRLEVVKGVMTEIDI